MLVERALRAIREDWLIRVGFSLRPEDVPKKAKLRSITTDGNGQCVYEWDFAKHGRTFEDLQKFGIPGPKEVGKP